LWDGGNKDGWLAYMQEVLGETIVDPNTLQGENYWIKDVPGGAATLWVKGENGTWEQQGEKNSLTNETGMAGLTEARLLTAASSGIDLDVKEAERLAGVLEKANIASEDMQAAILGTFRDGAIDFSKFSYEAVNSIDLGQLIGTEFYDAVS
jgi:hypothetical protein